MSATTGSEQIPLADRGSPAACQPYQVATVW